MLTVSYAHFLLIIYTDVPDTQEIATPFETGEVALSLEGLEAPTTEALVPETTETTAIDSFAEKPFETEEVSHEYVIRETAEAVSREETQEENLFPESQEAAPGITAAERFQTLITEIEEAFIEDYTKEEIPEIIEEELHLPKPSVSGFPQVESAPTEEEGFEIVELPKPEDIQEEVIPEMPAGQSPMFLQLLQNVEALEGQRVHFETIVKGFPQPEITWFLDGEPIKESPIYRIVTDASGTCILELPESFPEDEGEYECRAVNEFGTASTKADLYIQGQNKWFNCFTKILILLSI